MNKQRTIEKRREAFQKFSSNLLQVSVHLVFVLQVSVFQVFVLQVCSTYQSSMWSSPGVHPSGIRPPNIRPTCVSCPSGVRPPGDRSPSVLQVWFYRIHHFLFFKHERMVTTFVYLFLSRKRNMAPRGYTQFSFHVYCSMEIGFEKPSRGCQQAFQRLPKGFPEDFQRLSKGFLEIIHRVSRAFQRPYRQLQTALQKLPRGFLEALFRLFTSFRGFSQIFFGAFQWFSTGSPGAFLRN